MTLQFADPELEAAYNVHERKTYLTRVRVALVLALLATLTYIGLDLWVTDTSRPILQFRLFVCLPLAALALAMSYVLRSRLFPSLAALLSVVVVGFPAMLLIVGPEITMYAFTGFIQTLLFVTALVMLPFRYVSLTAVIGTMLMIGSLLAFETSHPDLQHLISLVVSFAVLLGFVVYMREKAQRKSFLRARRTETLHRDRLLQSADQIDWLRNLPAQLERDMRNSLFAIETELDHMLDGGTLDSAALARARGGLHDVMKMFETARFASDVDVVQQRFEPLDLSRLVQDVVLDRSREIEDVHAIELEVQADVWVHGNAELIRQSVIQLLNSATSDVHPDLLLQIGLAATRREVRLEVKVQEELVALGPNMLTNERFQLGLGLYLTRKIFEMHRGEFEVFAEDGVTRFTARMPPLDPSIVTQEPLVDQTS